MKNNKLKYLSLILLSVTILSCDATGNNVGDNNDNKSTEQPGPGPDSGDNVSPDTDTNKDINFTKIEIQNKQTVKTLNVEFKAIVESNLKNPNLTYLWNFGDGTTSTEKDITYTYKKDGRYDVSLIVTHTDSNKSETAYKSIYVAPESSVTVEDPSGINNLDFKYSQNKDNYDVTFDATSELKGVTEGNVEYTWNFNLIDSKTGKKSNYTFVEDGKYNIELIAKNKEKNQEVKISKNITVEKRVNDSIPAVKKEISNLRMSFTKGNSGYVGILNAGATTSPIGIIVNYEWIINDKSFFGADLVHDFGKSGEHKVKLIATDSKKSITKEIEETINIPAELPKEEITFTVDQTPVALDLFADKNKTCHKITASVNSNLPIAYGINWSLKDNEGNVFTKNESNTGIEVCALKKTTKNVILTAKVAGTDENLSKDINITVVDTTPERTSFNLPLFNYNHANKTVKLDLPEEYKQYDIKLQSQKYPEPKNINNLYMKNIYNNKPIDLSGIEMDKIVLTLFIYNNPTNPDASIQFRKVINLTQDIDTNGNISYKYEKYSPGKYKFTPINLIPDKNLIWCVLSNNGQLKVTGNNTPTISFNVAAPWQVSMIVDNGHVNEVECNNNNKFGNYVYSEVNVKEVDPNGKLEADQGTDSGTPPSTDVSFTLEAKQNGQRVDFTLTPSKNIDDLLFSNVSWDFGDQSPTVNSNRVLTRSYFYKKPGTYKVDVTVNGTADCPSWAQCIKDNKKVTTNVTIDYNYDFVKQINDDSKYHMVFRVEGESNYKTLYNHYGFKAAQSGNKDSYMRDILLNFNVSSDQTSNVNYFHVCSSPKCLQTFAAVAGNLNASTKPGNSQDYGYTDKDGKTLSIPYYVYDSKGRLSVTSPSQSVAAYFVLEDMTFNSELFPTAYTNFARGDIVFRIPSGQYDASRDSKIAKFYIYCRSAVDSTRRACDQPQFEGFITKDELTKIKAN